MVNCTLAQTMSGDDSSSASKAGAAGLLMLGLVAVGVFIMLIVYVVVDKTYSPSSSSNNKMYGAPMTGVQPTYVKAKVGNILYKVPITALQNNSGQVLTWAQAKAFTNDNSISPPANGIIILSKPLKVQEQGVTFPSGQTLTAQQGPGANEWYWYSGQ